MAGPTWRPAWLAGREWPSRCDFVRDRQALRPNFFSTIPVALTGVAQLRADGISSCCYVGNVHKHPSWAISCKEGMACYSTLVDPCLLSVWLTFTYPYSMFKLSGWQDKSNFVIYYFCSFFHFMKLFSQWSALSLTWRLFPFYMEFTPPVLCVFLYFF